MNEAVNPVHGEDRIRHSSLKIVFYGPSGSGKTTNLEYIYRRYEHRIKENVAMVKRAGDQRLFLDFLSLESGAVSGNLAGVHFYTVPGENERNAARRLVLKGANGIVFVGDSIAVRRGENIASFENLQANLAAQRRDISKIPLVFQYNKRDLQEQDIPLLTIDALERDLNRLQAPFFEASALTGINVIATMRKIVSIVLTSLQKELKQSKG